MQSKQEIIAGLQQNFDETSSFISSLSSDVFEAKPDANKWSISEEFDHLLIANVVVCSALKRSPHLIRWRFGRPNRGLRKYDQVQQRYTERISGVDRAVAPTDYLPKDAKHLVREEMLSHWTATRGKFETRINKWSDKRLDTLLLPHPLLGKMMVREVLFFTHFHSEYHLKSMKEKARNL